MATGALVMAKSAGPAAGGMQAAHDAGYAALVKEYRDGEDVKDEYRGCLGQAERRATDHQR